MVKNKEGKIIFGSKIRIFLAMGIVLFCLMGIPISLRGNESYI
ncbi:hypothetical protein SAMN02910275_02430 [Butyrivibrio sp. INlla18]|nr:hypothetical protein SAMN02910275_02430 [Butyrivibrio sp. INlla18]